jgi:hypothetical protein
MFPPGRYGRRRESRRQRRWAVPVALAVTVALLALLTIKLYGQYGTDAYTPTVLSVSGITDSSVTVKALVTKPDGSAATCTLNALAKNGVVVGTAEVHVAAGTSVTFSYVLNTTSRAYVADIPSCRPA